MVSTLVVLVVALLIADYFGLVSRVPGTSLFRALLIIR